MVRPGFASSISSVQHALLAGSTTEHTPTGLLMTSSCVFGMWLPLEVLCRVSAQLVLTVGHIPTPHTPPCCVPLLYQLLPTIARIAILTVRFHRAVQHASGRTCYPRGGRSPRCPLGNG